MKNKAGVLKLAAIFVALMMACLTFYPQPIVAAEDCGSESCYINNEWCTCCLSGGDDGACSPCGGYTC